MAGSRLKVWGGVSETPVVPHPDPAPMSPGDPRSGAERLEIPAAAALRRLDDLIAEQSTSCGVLIFGFDDDVVADHATVASRRLRGALTTMRRVWTPLQASFSRLREDRFLVIVDGLPDTVPATTFAQALRYETCSALRSHDAGAAEAFRVGVATPDQTASCAVELVRQAGGATAMTGLDVLLTA